jgi:hypothetical protein
MNAIWTLKSFYTASGRHYTLCIHEDGSLADSEIAVLTHHFPKARIVKRKDADARLRSQLRPFPRCASFRDNNILAAKLFDFVSFLQSDRMLIIDSDVLFFRCPSVLLDRIENDEYLLNSFNSDIASAYTVDPNAVRNIIGHELRPLINTGLGLVHRQSIRMEWIEEYLKIPTILQGHFWRIEQTLFALCSSRYGLELLPDEYTVDLTAGINGRPSRHYVGQIRHLMYGEGIAQLAKQGLVGYN